MNEGEIPNGRACTGVIPSHRNIEMPEKNVGKVGEVLGRMKGGLAGGMNGLRLRC